jgi:hypothetical protein
LFILILSNFFPNETLIEKAWHNTRFGSKVH